MNKIFILLIITGLCVSIVFLTLLVEWFLDDDRHDNKQYDDDSDMHIYVPHRSGNRRGNNGHDKQHEREDAENDN